MERIGVRELRQHASRYLARVRAGETIEVTDRGRPVARLVPISDRYQDLIDRGEIIPAENPIRDWEALMPVDLGFSASEELERLREDER